MRRVATHIKEMLEERGYNIEKEINLTFENGPYFKKQESPEKDRIYIYITRYIAKEKLGINDFNLSGKEAKKITEEILKQIIVNIQPKTKVIIIFPQKLLDKFSPEKILSLQTISSCLSLLYKNEEEKKHQKTFEKIVIFSEKDLKFNPTKNTLVPKHEIASKKDIELLNSKRIKKTDIPKI